MATSIITQFVLKQFAKKSARKTGVAQLLKANDPIVQSNVRNIEIILKDMGINTKNLTSTDDVLNAMNYRKAMMDQALKQEFKGLGLDKGIKSLEKKKYDDVTKKMWKDRPFPGFTPRVQQDVDSIIKNLKSMEPVTAMKEANLVIGRKGNYKHLSNDEAQRILKETDDHIFQRDIQYDEFGDPIKPEDMASGGIAGQLHLNEGGRAKFQDGALAAYQSGQDIIGAPVETQTAQEEISWQPGQAAPEGYEVKRALGDEWIERVQPSMPPVGPVPMVPGLSEQEAREQFEAWENASRNATPQEHLSMGLHAGPGMVPPVPPAGTSIDGRVITQEDIDTYNFTKNRREAERLTEMQARGIDPRMARSYQENIQLMGDPRMSKPVEMGSGQAYAEKHNIPYASGGIAGHLNRPGYRGGKLVWDTVLKLLKGKKKNVWRGFETDYKNILKGDWYPEEFSGRFFTPDKDLAKWYAMRQGTLTGKVKKLKLTEKEIKEAQEFAEKNLKMKYGDDLLVSKELAEKAKVDLPATALAKIEAVIRKAKGTKKAKKHGQKDFATGGRASYTKGGLAHVLGV